MPRLRLSPSGIEVAVASRALALNQLPNVGLPIVDPAVAVVFSRPFHLDSDEAALISAEVSAAITAAAGACTMFISIEVGPAPAGPFVAVMTRISDSETVGNVLDAQCSAFVPAAPGPRDLIARLVVAPAGGTIDPGGRPPGGANLAVQVLDAASVSFASP